jgi:hypothetical protein
MNLSQRLLVCESVLARLDAALAFADEEIECTSAAEQQMRGLVSRLQAENERADYHIRPVSRTDPYVSLLVANENVSEANRFIERGSYQGLGGFRQA